MKKEYNYLKNEAEVLHSKRRKRNICRIRGIQPYNPVLMRFTGVDPLASKYPAISLFAYCGNNPINRIDPDGCDVWEINDQGEIIKRIKDETQDMVAMVAQNKNGVYERIKDTDGNDISISFEYGTVELQKSVTFRLMDKIQARTMFIK